MSFNGFTVSASEPIVASVCVVASEGLKPKVISVADAVKKFSDIRLIIPECRVKTEY